MPGLSHQSQDFGRIPRMLAGFLGFRRDSQFSRLDSRSSGPGEREWRLDEREWELDKRERWRDEWECWLDERERRRDERARWLDEREWRQPERARWLDKREWRLDERARGRRSWRFSGRCSAAALAAGVGGVTAGCFEAMALSFRTFAYFVLGF